MTLHYNSLQAHQLNIQFDTYRKMSDKIVELLRSTGKELRGDQIAKMLGKEYHKISGRFSSLKEKGLIEVVRSEKVGHTSFQVFKAK